MLAAMKQLYFASYDWRLTGKCKNNVIITELFSIYCDSEYHYYFFKSSCFYNWNSSCHTLSICEKVMIYVGLKHLVHERASFLSHSPPLSTVFQSFQRVLHLPGYRPCTTSFFFFSEMVLTLHVLFVYKITCHTHTHTLAFSLSI